MFGLNLPESESLSFLILAGGSLGSALGFAALQEGVFRIPGFKFSAWMTVLTTFTLCTIPNVYAALREARRVLKPDGKLVFLEHGLAPEPAVARWQRRLNPLWAALAGGCQLIRDPKVLLENAGWHIEEAHQAVAMACPDLGC